MRRVLASETRNKGVVSALLSSWLLFEALVRAVLLSAVMLSAVALAYNRSPRPFTAHACRTLSLVAVQSLQPVLHCLGVVTDGWRFAVATAAELCVSRVGPSVLTVHVRARRLRLALA